MTSDETDVTIHNTWISKFKIKKIVRTIYPNLVYLEKLNTRRRLLRLSKVNVDNDHNLNYDAFDVHTDDKKYFCQKNLERAKIKLTSSVLLSNI